MRTLFHHATLFVLRPWLWGSGPLRESRVSDDPMEEFAHWFRMANRCLFLEFPDGMALSTISPEGWPEVRWVLLKGFDARGFVFFTNRDSQKGQALAATPRAALGFFWDALQRQIRVQGAVEPVSEEESDAYFATRPRGSQLGAWASKQSSVLSGPDEFNQRIREAEEQFAGIPVSRPPYWGGYRVIPEVMEFWKLRASRLHDRFEYRRGESGGWERRRLYP